MTMAYTGAGFLDESWQQSTRNVGGVLSAIARRCWPKNTAKQVARTWDIDLGAATNLTKGHASERTITKALLAGDWPLLMQLGEALYGTTYAEHLLTVAQEAEHARIQAADRAAYVAHLERIASGESGLAYRPSDVPTRKQHRRAHGVGHGVGGAESADPPVGRQAAGGRQ